tara:strand:+ start:729 stop:1295 length:567 start_codon:yes stop_codon:yes gene_type:complete
MNKLFIVLILVFTTQIPSLAEDIKDFEIEEVSIGDSALQFLSKDEIEKKEKHFYYKLRDYYTIIYSNPDFKTYEFLNLNIRNGDTEFIIVSVEGVIKKDFSSCASEKKNIEKELRSQFKNQRFVLGKKSENDGAKYLSSSLYFSNNSAIRVLCTGIIDKSLKEQGYIDSLRVVINSKEFTDFLIREYE